jgi:hypothetical protein
MYKIKLRSAEHRSCGETRYSRRRRYLTTLIARRFVLGVDIPSLTRTSLAGEVAALSEDSAEGKRPQNRNMEYFTIRGGQRTIYSRFLISLL